MVKETLPRTVTERFADLFREMEQSDAYHVDGAKVEIAEQIYLAMKRQGVPATELARRLGKSRAYITKVLQGNVTFTIELLVQIARALNSRVDFRLLPSGASDMPFALRHTWGIIDSEV